jgi:hypothetical protein
MSEKWFVIVDGDVVRQVTSLKGEDVKGKQVIEAARRGDLQVETIAEDGTWTCDVDAVRGRAMDVIDQEREQRQQVVLTAGTAKAIVYAQKGREVDRYARMAREDVESLSPSQSWERFPAAMAELEEGGGTLIEILDRFTAGAARANAVVFQIEAVATAAKRAIRSAVTPESIKAAANVTWPAGVDA